MIYTGSYLKSGISFERNHIFLSTVLTKLLGDAFPMKRLRVFYLSVTNLHAADTLVPTRLLKRCCKVGSIGLLCSKILINFARRAVEPNGRKDLETRYDAPQPNSKNRTLYLGHRLYGSIS